MNRKGSILSEDMKQWNNVGLYIVSFLVNELILATAKAGLIGPLYFVDH